MVKFGLKPNNYRSYSKPLECIQLRKFLFFLVGPVTLQNTFEYTNNPLSNDFEDFATSK
jgi:hypothetical protein